MAKLKESVGHNPLETTRKIVEEGCGTSKHTIILSNSDNDEFINSEQEIIITPKTSSSSKFTKTAPPQTTIQETLKAPPPQKSSNKQKPASSHKINSDKIVARTERPVENPYLEKEPTKISIRTDPFIKKASVKSKTKSQNANLQIQGQKIVAKSHGSSDADFIANHAEWNKILSRQKIESRHPIPLSSMSNRYQSIIKKRDRIKLSYGNETEIISPKKKLNISTGEKSASNNEYKELTNFRRQIKQKLNLLDKKFLMEIDEIEENSELTSAEKKARFSQIKESFLMELNAYKMEVTKKLTT